MKYFTTLIAVLLCLASSSMHAQRAVEIGNKVELTTKDGNTIIGTVTEFTDEHIVLKTDALGEITIPREEVETYRILDNEQSQDIYNSTTYLVNPSGYTLNKGQSYYQNIGVFFNSYTAGISDNFSITGGLELISPLFLQRAPAFFISPRLSIPFANEQGAFSVGATSFLFFGDSGDTFFAGIAQGAVTIGSRSNNFTIGAGIGFTAEDGFEESVIPFNFSGMFRLSEKLSLVTDNFAVVYNNFSDGFGLFSAALRIHFKSQASVNVGLWRGFDSGDILALPFLSLTLPIK